MTDWRRDAACLALDPEDCDPVRGYRENPEQHAERIAAVKAMCNACPVIAECLTDELDSGRRPWHIRAGHDPDELLKARNRRSRNAARRAARELAKEKTA